MRIPLVECPVCRELHPIRFDPDAGIDGDQAWVCHEVGEMQLANEPLARLRDLVVVQVHRE